MDMFIFYNDRIIRMCLDVYSRSPSAYASMFNSEIFKALPTARLLRMYKNCVKQGTGLVSDNLQWLMSEADKLGYQFGSPERLGGLSIDEVSIQVLFYQVWNKYFSVHSKCIIMVLSINCRYYCLTLFSAFKILRNQYNHNAVSRHIPHTW